MYIKLYHVYMVNQEDIFFIAEWLHSRKELYIRRYKIKLLQKTCLFKQNFPDNMQLKY